MMVSMPFREVTRGSDPMKAEQGNNTHGCYTAGITCCPVNLLAYICITELTLRVCLDVSIRSWTPVIASKCLLFLRFQCWYKIAEALDMRSFTKRVGAAGLCKSGQWAIYPLDGSPWHPAYCSRSVLTCLYTRSANIHKTQWQSCFLQ